MKRTKEQDDADDRKLQHFLRDMDAIGLRRGACDRRLQPVERPRHDPYKDL